MNFFEGNASSHKNIVVPFVPVIGEDDTSREGKYRGMSMKAAFQREGEKVLLQLQFNNRSSTVFSVSYCLFRTLL